MWISQTEGAKFWLSVITELKNRAVQDILVACVDGLKAFLEVIASVYPIRIYNYVLFTLYATVYVLSAGNTTKQ